MAKGISNGGKGGAARRVIRDCECFFCSEWFEMINPFPQIHGEDIIEMCRTGAFKWRV